MKEQDGPYEIMVDATPKLADGGALRRRAELTQPVFGALLITGVPPVIFLAMLIPRAVELTQHRPATALTALEILALFVLMAAALIISVIAGAGLKRALVEPPYKRSLWIVGVLQLAVFAQLLFAGFISRELLGTMNPLPSNVTGPISIAAIAWVFLVGYVAKIPWDSAVSIVADPNFGRRRSL